MKILPTEEMKRFLERPEPKVIALDPASSNSVDAMTYAMSSKQKLKEKEKSMSEEKRRLWVCPHCDAKHVTHFMFTRMKCLGCGKSTTTASPSHFKPYEPEDTPVLGLLEEEDMDSARQYKELVMVLKRAYNQAAIGKGKERHANDRRFIDQPILTIARLLGSNHGQLQQAMKKIQESTRLKPDMAVAELLGAINYLAAAVIIIDEQIIKES